LAAFDEKNRSKKSRASVPLVLYYFILQFHLYFQKYKLFSKKLQKKTNTFEARIDCILFLVLRIMFWHMLVIIESTQTEDIDLKFKLSVGCLRLDFLA
jgi:hypothetical protein